MDAGQPPGRLHGDPLHGLGSAVAGREGTSTDPKADGPIEASEILRHFKAGDDETAGLFNPVSKTADLGDRQTGPSGESNSVQVRRARDDFNRFGRNTKKSNRQQEPSVDRGTQSEGDRFR